MAELERDPTRTITLRRRFAQDARARYQRIARDIRASLVQNDALGLRTNEPLPEGAFEFSTDAQKVAGFREWLREQLASRDLSTPPDLSDQAARNHWMGRYLTEAYQRGIRRAQAEMRRAGIQFETTAQEAAEQTRMIDRPVHAQRVAAIYTRAFNELNGVSDALAQQITRELTDGMAQGLSPMEIARNLANRVDKVGRHRATLLARTETIRAHHVATIEEYRRAEVEGVRIRAEFATAGDSRVCRRCRGLEGTIYSLREIEGVIPVHPQCRCVALPVTDSPEG